MTDVILRPSPFRFNVIAHTALPGQSIEQILRALPELPPEVWTHGVVRIGEWEIPRERWHLVRPRPGSQHLVQVGVRLSDGGGSKNIFGTIAAIALLVAATAISGGILGPAGSLSISGTLFGAGSTSAALLAAGVSVVGALALSALAPAPAVEEADDAKRPGLGSASIRGNALEPFAPIPFVIGTHRVSPPHLIMPWSEAVNDDQFVYAIVGLNGAHAFEDIRINGAPIDEFEEVEYEVRDVVADDTDITLITNQVYENQVGAEVLGHKIADDASDELQDATTPANSYPKWQAARSRATPTEIWLTFAWTGLIHQEDSGGTNAGGVPVRIRIRRVGDEDWINLPEFHAQRERLEPFRGTIKLRFEAAPSSLTRPDQAGEFPPWGYALFIEDADNDESFDVDSYFEPSSGNNADAVGVTDGAITVYLDPATFTPGTYDVQVKRGYGYKTDSFTSSTYVYDTATPYFFSHIPASSPPAIRKEQVKVPSKMSWVSLSSVWEEYPLGEKGLALIAVKAKNIAINSLTVLASGYANTWDGADWDTFEATANPAAWFRYLALGGQSVRAPFVAAQLDDDGLADWFDYCDDDNGITRECNAFIDGAQSLGEVMRIIAACGRAAPRVSDQVGVVIDNDRSGDTPIQLFTPRNSRGLSIRRAFPRIPDAMRVRYNDETNDYQPAEATVYRRQLPGPITDIEAITYVGITSEARAVERAQHDFAQLLRRGSLYNLETDIENIYCVKGSLVALAHDTIARHHDAARVVSVQTSGGNVTGLTLDTALRLTLITELGGAFPAGVVIQLKDGTTMTAEIDEEVDTATITFATPFTIPADDALDEDCLVACGPFSSETRRMLVLGVEPRDDYTASLTLVDEAEAIPVVSTGGDQIVSTGADRIVAPF